MTAAAAVVLFAGLGDVDRIAVGVLGLGFGLRLGLSGGFCGGGFLTGLLLSLGLGSFLRGLALGFDVSRLLLGRLLFCLRLGSCLLSGFAIGLGLGCGFLGRLAIPFASASSSARLASSAAFAASTDCSVEPVLANDCSAPDDPEQPINPPKHSTPTKTQDRTFSLIEMLLISSIALLYF